MYFTILRRQYKAFSPGCSPPLPLQSQRLLPRTSVLLSAAWPDHIHTLLHFSMYPTSCRIRPQRDQSSQQWFSLLLNGRKGSWCTAKLLVKQHPMYNLASLYCKLDKNLLKKKKKIILYFPMHHTKFWPQTSHLISIIRKSRKPDPVVQIQSLKGKELDICLDVFSWDYARPRFGNKWLCKSSSIELSMI